VNRRVGRDRDNDSSVVVRVPGPAYAVWSSGPGALPNVGGNTAQNFTGARHIEDYCNDKVEPGENPSLTCFGAANYERVAFILNDTWGRLGLTDVTVNTFHGAASDHCSANNNPNPAVMIDGLSAPASASSPSGASGPMRIGPLPAPPTPDGSSK
jgi:hypothetical protein